MADTKIENSSDITESVVAGILPGDHYGVHIGYQSRARKAGATVVELKEFWNKFRRRFPGSHWRYVNHGWDEYVCVGRGVVVCLKPEDAELASKIDKWGWFVCDGGDAILDAFIETQDQFSGDPHPSDWLSAFTSGNFLEVLAQCCPTRPTGSLPFVLDPVR